MNDLVRSWYDHVSSERNFDNLGLAVLEGLKPFKPGKLEAYIHEDWGSGRTLRVCVDNLPNSDFVMSLDLISLTQAPDGGLFQIYQRVFKHYRYRPALPIDDHIILGED